MSIGTGSNTTGHVRTPAARVFQLDSHALGNIANSVNVFRGDVSLPLSLVNLDGPHGLGVALSASYASNVTQQVSTCNLEAPTGALGLGWSLPFELITFQSNGTPTWFDGAYTLYAGGAPMALTLVAASGDGDDEVATFATRSQPLWDIRYWPARDRWQIRKDDGSIAIFGDPVPGRSTVQWGVRWGGWTGASAVAKPKQRRFAVAWNLATLTNVWGDQLTYGYDNDDLALGGDGESYTRASYLTSITDGYGQRVLLRYRDKDPAEYQAPHRGPDADDVAYQDRYETRYLSSIEVVAAPVTAGPGSGEPSGDATLYELGFGFSLHDVVGAAAPGMSTVKRYLDSVTELRNRVEASPPMTFEYDLDPASGARGRLRKVGYPEGGSATWTYSAVDLNPARNPIFSSSFDAERPRESEFQDAVPRVFFGGDYIVVLWYSAVGGEMAVRMYEYGGRWSEPFELDIPAATDLASLQFVPGSDFFGLYFHDNGATERDLLRLFRKDPVRFGRWSVSSVEVPLRGEPDPRETALVGGDDFVGFHAGGSGAVTLVHYDPLADEWRANCVSKGGAHVAIAAAGNTAYVGFYDDAAEVMASSMYYRDPRAPAANPWRELGPANSGSFPWFPQLARGYWAVGAGFAAGTYPTSDDRSQMLVLRPSFGFTSLNTAVLDGDDLSTQAAGATISNGSRLYRFDGERWTESRWSVDQRSFVAVAGDVAVNVEAFGSGYQGHLGTYDAYATSSPSWDLVSFPPSGAARGGELEPPERIGPQLSQSFLTLQTTAYHGAPDGTWRAIGGLTKAREDTVLNRGPVFMAWEDDPGSIDDTRTYAALLGNGEILDTSSFDAARIQASGAPGTVLAGTTAFATYPASQRFETARVFTLRRVLNRSIAELQTDCAVASVEISTAEGVGQRTSYRYDADTAVFDPSGQVVQYPRVVCEQTSIGGAESLGRQELRFYNGLAPADSCTVGDSPVESYYSLLNGLLRAAVVYDADGEVVATQDNAWTAVVLTPESRGGFARLPNTVAIKLGRQVDGTHGLDVVALGGTGGLRPGGAKASLDKEQRLTYDPVTGYQRSIELRNVGSDGQVQRRRAITTYAHEIDAYAGMRAARQLAATAQITFCMNDTPVQSSVQTYSNQWGGARAWGQAASWQWRGDGAPEFDFGHTDENAGWWRLGASTARNAAGSAIESENAVGVTSSVLFDQLGKTAVATFANAKVSAGQASYTGFQAYEADQGWRRDDGSMPVTTSEDSHTGARSVKIEPGAALTATFSADPTLGRVILSSYVKAASGRGGVKAAWTITAGSSAPVTVDVPDRPDRWSYLFAYVDVPTAGAAADVVCTLRNHSAHADVLVDDIRFSPVVCEFTAKVYSEHTRLEVAELGQNGETWRTLYDRRLRVVATTGPDAAAASITASYFALDAVGIDPRDPSNHNSDLTLMARAGGVFDDFRSKDWQSRWSTSTNPSDWAIHGGALTLQATTPSSVTLLASADWDSYAAQTQVLGADGASTLGLRVGDELTVQYTAATAMWQMLDATGKVISSLAAPISASMSWVLIAMPHSAAFFVNGQLTLQATLDQASIGGALSFFADAAGVGFAQVVTLLAPLASLGYTDGGGNPTQSQAMDDDRLVVCETLYDGLGRADVMTKPAVYAGASFGYRPDFALLDRTTWQMSGFVGAYYRGQDGRSDDEGFPYWRKRIERSSRSRLLEAGKPGPALAIRAGNPHTTRFVYGVNAAGGVFSELPAGQYPITVSIDADGNAAAVVSDQVGNIVARMWGPGDLDAGPSLAAAYLLDPRDNPAALRPPNYYAPPTGTPDAWVSTTRYDTLGRRVHTHSNDTDVTRQAYDTAGRIRFTLEADGVGAGPAGEDRIIYNRYDALGRLVEQGWLSATWDQVVTEVDNRSYPSEVATWRHRYRFDGDGVQPYALGRNTEVWTQGRDRAVVVERFEFDLFGRTTSRSTTIADEATGTADYAYDRLGNVLMSTFTPSGGEAVTVSYGYDALGRVTTIGKPGAGQEAAYARYGYDAAGNVAWERLAEGSKAPIETVYTYASPGWLRAREGALFAETLSYDDGVQPRYTGLITGVDYALPGTHEPGGAPVSARWSYGYDATGRLRTAARTTAADGAPASGFGFDYDPNGNPTALTTDGRQTRFGYYDGADQLKRTSSRDGDYTYLPSGALEASPDHSVRYDFTSGLAEEFEADLIDAASVALTFGTSSQRLRKVVTRSDRTVETRTYLPGVDLLAAAELWRPSSGPARQVTYVRGPVGLVAVEAGGDTLFVLRDHEGSNRVLVAPGQAPTAVLDYGPFGRLVAAAGGTDPGLLAYRFTGQEWDEELALYNFRDRVYDPDIMHFLSPDPDQEFFSPYSFVGNDPLLRVDPSGDVSVFGALFSGAELAAGALLTLSGFGAGFGLPLLAQGATGMGYTLRSGDHFDTGNYFKVELATSVSVAEIGSGAALSAASEVLGPAASIGGDTLMGAGVSGLTNTVSQVLEAKDGSFSLTQWGKEEAIGAITGLISAGLSEGFSALGAAAGRALSAAPEAAAMAGDAATSAAVDAATQATKQVTTESIGKGIGAVIGGTVGESAKSFTESTLRDVLYGKRIDWSANARKAFIGGVKGFATSSAKQFGALGWQLMKPSVRQWSNDRGWTWLAGKLSDEAAG
ncbi:RHS repeat domain-containing protein [Haliangium sp.]|uniref:RHS repeat domain-containing protein n=1 Tax=Haliangium sp. TaxID=2663208 RepID=UPI003D0CCBCD